MSAAFLAPDFSSSLLAECEGKGLNAGVKELDLECPVFDSPLLPNELIETGLLDLASAVR
jgi:hypothetical protein